MKNFKKVILTFLLVLTTISVSLFSFAYSPTSSDKAIAKLVISKVEELKKTKPSIINILKKVLPKVQQKYKQEKKYKFVYIIWELISYLNWNDDLSDDTNLNNNFQKIRKKSEFQTVYEVWPWKQYSDLNQIPREDLKPSTLILIYYRTQPYKNKFVINVSATKTKPVVILWIPDKNGNLPKIDWNSAITRQQLDYRNEERSLIKVWWSSKPSENIKPSRIYIENLDIYWAKYWNSFVDDHWKRQKYSKNATCVHIEYWDNIFLRNNKIHNCSNWIFTTHFTDHIFIQWNQIYNNWNVWDIYTHNTYTESKNIVYEYNYMWKLLNWAKWNNLKDRSAWTIIRYNWIEWWNRQIDLVETSYDELKNLSQYNKTYVYWNILVEDSDEWNQQILHYGWDWWDKSKYRNWILYFYNNTVVSYRNWYTTLINLSLNSAQMFVYNNIFYTKAWPGNFALSDWRWQFYLENNVLPTKRKQTHNSYFDWQMFAKNNIETNEPWFQNTNFKNYHLLRNSVAIWKAKKLDNQFLPVSKQYKNKAKFEIRKSVNDIWAFESNFKNVKKISDWNNDLNSSKNAGSDIFKLLRNVDNSICNKSLWDLTKKVQKKTFFVNSENEIRNALKESKNIDEFVEIVIKKWTYKLTNWFRIDGWNVIIRGETWNPSDVILLWKWMNGGVSHIFWIASSNVYIGDLTIWNVANHPIQIHWEKNADNIIIHNLIIKDAGEQMIKGSYDKNRPDKFTNNAIVECSKLYYSAWIWPQYYIWWIDVHHWKHWLVQYNFFKNIRSPESRIAEHAIHFWNNSNDVIIKENRIENCDRWIWFWLWDSGFSSWKILNNIILHDKSRWDVGIWLENAHDVYVYWNTINLENNYPNAIEYRFPWTYNVIIEDNDISNHKLIKSRDWWKAIFK